MISTLAADSHQAQRELERAKRGERPYSLVLADAYGTDLDGFALLEQIIADGDDDSACILVLSAAAPPQDFARCRSAGIPYYMTKPIKESDVLSVLSRALGLEEGVTATGEGSAPDETKGLSILLAEDNSVNQQLAARLLEKKGHNVAIANNGSEAVVLWEQGHFDLVLMDVQMPVMDGFEATAAIREKERTTNSRVPVIALTANAMSGDRERCIAAGMDSYVSKPIRPDQLFEEMTRVVVSLEDERNASS